MLHWWRLKRAHATFLESCRNLAEGRSYWQQSGGVARWVLETLSPVPLLSLEEDGRRLLEALQWLETNCRKRPLDEQVLREYGRRILRDNAGPAGDYRRGSISVIGSAIPRPSADKIRALMKQLDSKLKEEQAALDSQSTPDESAVFGSAVALHQRIAFIHPFPDGNGRIARLAMNHLLRRYGLGYSILPPVNESPEHLNAIEEAHRGNLEFLGRLVRSC